MRLLSFVGNADWGIYSDSNGTLTARSIGEELPKGDKLVLQNDDGAGNAIAAEDLTFTYVSDNS